MGSNRRRLLVLTAGVLLNGVFWSVSAHTEHSYARYYAPEVFDFYVARHGDESPASQTCMRRETARMPPSSVI